MSKFIWKSQTMEEVASDTVRAVLAAKNSTEAEAMVMHALRLAWERGATRQAFRGP